MFVYIWIRVPNLTSYYHAEGDCTVIAENLEAARELLKSLTEGNFSDITPQSEVFTEDPTHCIPLDPSWTQNLVIISPNAGCC